MTHTLFATCPRGLETILSKELTEQGCTNIHPTDGGVSAQGGLEQIYRANLHSRTAGRILMQIGYGRCRNEADLYRLAYQTSWEKYFDTNATFRVKTNGKRASLKSLEFASLKIKDAICDRFREYSGKRPSIDKHHPDVRIHAFINEDNATLFVDTSGEALFKRGYRQDTGEAPLRENLAAGMLMLAGYNGTQPFQDPFCGSGTIAIEAAWIALKRAPGLMRHFAFERLDGFDAVLWQRLRHEALSQILKSPIASIAASDNKATLIHIARTNAHAAGVDELINWQTLDIQDTRPQGEHGILISNPPYGIRLDEIQTLHALYPQLGSWLKQHYAGWTAGMLSADREMPKIMRLSPKRKIPLYNGNLECRLFLFDMVAGSNRK